MIQPPMEGRYEGHTQAPEQRDVDPIDMGVQHIELALEQARYEAARAHRQYNAVDPDNRLVVGDLERRWNERLAEVVQLEGERVVARENQPVALTEADRAEILALGTDLPRLWNHPAATAATRKRIRQVTFPFRA